MNYFSAFRRSFANLTERPTHELLRLVSDGGIVTTLICAPLFMGGRDERGALVYAVCVAVATIAWAASQLFAPQESRSRWRSSAAQYLLLAGMLLVTVQIVPLPVDMLARLSPAAAEWLPVWHAGDETATTLGEWKTVSLVPRATQAGLAIYVAHAMFFLLLTQRLNSLTDVQRLLRLLALGCVGFAALGLLQFMSSNGKFLWTYEHPYRHTDNAVKGFFINENHFAHLLALGLGPCIWMLQSMTSGSSTAVPRPGEPRRRRKSQGWESSGPGGKMGPPGERLILYMFALAVVALAGMLTFSRGGAIALLISGGCAVALYFWKSLLGREYAITFGVAALFAAIGLFIFGGEHLTNELATLTSGDIEQIDHGAVRQELWVADLEAAREFPLLGTGVGSHVDVYPVKYETNLGVHLTHAESGYVHLALETGASGLLLALVAIGMIGRWCWRALRSDDVTATACGIAATAGLIASMTHSAWDFVWFLPACMSWTIALAAIACRLSQLSTNQSPAAASLSSPVETRGRSTSSVVPTGAWAAITLCIAAMSLVSFQTLAPAASAQSGWENYLRLEVAHEQEESSPDDPSFSHEAIALLQLAVQQDPRHSKAHLALASACLQRFAELQRESENRMSLAQIRQAVLASEFSSRTELHDWMQTAFGENQRLLGLAQLHALRAVELSPLQGDGYILLADLAFLNGAGKSTSEALLNQALTVRPTQGTVLYAVGSHAALDGRSSDALSYWKLAFRHDRRMRKIIIEQVAPRLSAAVFLKTFELELPASRSTYRLYASLGRVDDVQVIGEYYSRQLSEFAIAESPDKAARAWMALYRLHRKLEQPVLAMQAIRRAVEARPDDFSQRQAFAIELLAQSEYERANEELKWCLARKPSDGKLKSLALRAKRGLWDTAEKSTPTNR